MNGELTKDLEEMSYLDFVKMLVKPGEQLVSEITPEKAHIWHMASKLPLEVMELELAIFNKDLDNILEELGDIEFYFAGIYIYMRDICQVDIDNELNDARSHEVIPPYLNLSPMDAFKFAVMNLCDYALKNPIYDKQLDLLDLCNLIVDVECCLSGLYIYLNTAGGLSFDIDDIEKLNKLKLSKRYHTLTYSNQQAITRKDKNG